MTVAPSPRALTTLDEYKTYKDPGTLPADQSTTTDDHFQTLINAIGDLYKGYCKRPLIYETCTEAKDGDNVSASIWVDNYPVVLSTPPVVTEDRGFGPNTLTKDVDYKVRPEVGEFVRTSGNQLWFWPMGVMNCSFTYTAGKWADTASVDWDMKALAMQGVDWLHTLGPATYGRRLVDAGVITPDDLPAPIKLGLKPYKRQRF